MALVFSVIVVVISFIYLNKASKDATETIQVLRVKLNEGLPAYSVITEGNIEKYSIIKKEYTDDMILAEDMPEVVNKLSRYYLRGRSVLFKDQLIDEKPKKNEWLYELDEDMEVVTIPYNYLECGGDVLLPGDTVRIRVSYEVEEDMPLDSIADLGNPNTVVTETKGRKVVTQVLFDSIVIKDMLNANSHSIYEVYKEVMRLGEEKRQEVMKSEDFLQNIQPRSLLLAGTSDQMNEYAKFKSADAKSFLITILSRANSDVILDDLPTLQNEVEMWIEKSQKD
jgi:hypothetical protein